MPEGDERTYTTTVEIEGTEHEVTIPLDDSLLTVEEVNKRYIPKSSLKERLARATKDRYSVDDILENEDLLGRIAGEREDWLRERLKIEGDKPDVSKLHDQWRATERKPLEEENEALKQTLSRSRERHREADVSAAAVKLGVKPSQLPLLGPFYRDHTKWSDEHGRHFVVDRDGEFVFDPSAKEGDPPYLTIEADLEQKHRSGEYADWFDGKGRQGSGYSGGGGGGGDRTPTLEQFEKMTDSEKTAFYGKDREKYLEYMNAITERDSAKLFSGS